MDLSARLNDIADELARTLDGCVNVSLLDDSGWLRATAVRHPNRDAQCALGEITQTATLRPGEGVAGRVAATAESVLLSPLTPHEALALAPEPYRNFLARFPIYALMAAPLIARGRVIGVVSASRAAPGQEYTPEDVRLLEELCERAAAAIDNSRLYTDSVDARRRAEQLYRFASSVADARTIDAVYESALESAATALSASRSAILSFDGGREMRFRAWHNLSDAYRAAVDGHSPWTLADSSPEPVLVPDAQNSPEWRAYRDVFVSEGIGALAFVPLVSGGLLLGKLMVYYDSPHVFSAHELSTAAAIANHLGSVMKRFEIVRKLEDTVLQNELFAAVLAHDLRNPLGAITTSAEFCLMSDTVGQDGERGKALARILSSGKRMATMIAQLLDFTKARTSVGFQIELNQVDIHDVARDAVSELALAHRDWAISLEAIGDTICGGDKARLTQVLSNLIANAGEHGDADGPIRVAIDGSSADVVVVVVRNNGVIPAEIRSDLFAPFRRGRQSHSGSSGLGLGLFIVREIVRAHGGTVCAQSCEQAETSIRVALPRQLRSAE